ncbi:MAG TPA: ABC transporter permease [Candidatus Acidoferrales bacterium]|nr:ABC transporter permease [Candidatus Acidoferrales bacterium]
MASRRVLVGTASVIAFLALWQVVGSTNFVRSDLISYPSEVVATLIKMSSTGELGSNALVSLDEFVMGFVPAVIAGVAAGIVLALVRRLRLLLDPLLVAIYQAPIIAFIPILVVWFGVGTTSKIVMVFISAFFPVMINTMTGVAQVAEPWTRAVRSFGASTLQVVSKAILPGSLPAIMAGMRLGVGRAVVVLIAGEMYVSVMGIGRLVQVYSSAARASEIVVLVVVISGFGFACVSLLRWLENKIGPWRQELE